MRTRPPPHTRAFTLIEMLVALVVFGGIFAMIASLLPANTASIIRDVKASEAQVSTTQMSTAIGADFQRRGTFAGFIQASSTAVNAIFKTSEGFDPTPSADFANDQILSVPRLKANVGDHLLIVNTNGSAKVLTVTAVNGTAFSHDGCTNGMLAGNTQVYKADLLNIVFNGNDVLRGFNGGPLVKAGQGGQLEFEFLYRDRYGHLVLNPPGAPQNLSSDGSQLAYLKIGVAKDRGGSANAVPLEPSPLRQLIDCNATLPGAAIDNQLKVSVSGLPSGVDADVTTSGPGMAATPTPVTTIYPVRQGMYNVTANPVTVGGVTYTPTVDGGPVNMTGFAQRSYVAVTYKPPGIRYGGITLTVTGLNGASSTLDIFGPTSFTTSIIDGTLNIDNLLPGTYILTPAPTGTASPAQPTYTLVVPSGPRTPVTIDYGRPGTGNLAITVTGLNGASATAAITGPSGATAFLMDGVVNFNNLPAGNYVLTPTTSGTLTPEQGSYTFAITPGQTTPVTVNYKPGTGGCAGTCPPPPPGGGCPGTCPPQIQGCTVNCADIGNLNINVSGLNGTQATSYLSGAYTANIPLTDGTVSVTSLPVGSYILNPFANANHTPNASTISFVISKDTTQTVTVVYSPGRIIAPTGIINLSVTGLPGVSSANVNVTGPATVSMNQQDTTRQVSDTNAPVGSYTINAPTATNAQGVSVTPAVNGRVFALANGQRVDVVIDYTAAPGPGPGPGPDPQPTCTVQQQRQGDCTNGSSQGPIGIPLHGGGYGCPPGMYISACQALDLTTNPSFSNPVAPPGTPADVFFPGGAPGQTNPSDPTSILVQAPPSFCAQYPGASECTGESGSGSPAPTTPTDPGVSGGTNPPTPPPAPTPTPTPTPTPPPGTQVPTQ